MKIYQYPPSVLTVAAQDSFFQYNGAQQVVEQDTTNDANNRAFPSLQFIYVDGDQVPVTKDNVTPANTVPLPVEIIGAGASTLLTGILDAGNSSTVALGSGGVFTGTAFDITSYAAINVNVKSDVASATNGVKVEFSPDGTNWDHSHSTTYTGTTGVGYIFNAEFRFARVVYTNGASAQSFFRLQTIFKTTLVKSSLYTLDQTVTGNMFAELGKNVIIGKTTGGGGGFVDVKVNPSGALTTETQLTSGTSAIGTVRVTNQLVPVNFDELVISYVGATTDISTVVYKLATATVATVTLSYDGSNRLTGVVRS
jgi:hypothetical protein